ncbi:hypothetical protein F4821DRAFT_16645 [Hypoxylon rubiginosum]|uniref:Uncharacterized protein n=1 Tax=Hypoxylon rubiginosum TaxID=110542 RepID=A0ACC0CN50_9PEZI|nr:hypothetical protein F4821DRAFT_16645 [Hypoxylon rubiginosum]
MATNTKPPSHARLLEKTRTSQSQLGGVGDVEYDLDVESSEEDGIRKTIHLPQWVVDYWIWEFVSWIVSVTLLAGIAVTLVLHQNRPLPDWPFGITINALISLLSTLSTSALLVVVSGVIGQHRWSSFATTPGTLSRFEVYDEATRGPLGALGFLFTMKLNLISLAPLVIIFSLASGPFIQQVVVLEPSDMVFDAASLLSRTDYPNLEGTRGFMNPLAYPNVPDLVVASFYQGLYFSGNLTSPSSRNTLQPQPACSSGNCTYPDFDSLAVCSACANITDYLMPESHINGSSGTWSWALPNNFSTSEEFYEGGSSGSSLVVSTGGKYHPLALQAGLPIVNITAIQPCVDADGRPCDAIAQECMLYWCLNRYRAKVIQGVYYEDVLDTVKYGRTINPDLLENDTYVFQTNYSNPEYSTADNRNSAPFSVSKWGSAALTDLLAQDLQVDIWSDDFGSIDDFLEMADGYSAFPNIPLNMAPFFEAMSISLTTSVKSNLYDEAGTQFVMGQATKTVSMVRVRWAWISLPISLQVVTLGLLCYVVANTSRQKLPVWKNSILATIFVGAMMHDRLPRTTPQRLTAIQRAAEKVKISQEDTYS